MSRISFTIPGKPMGKQRARTLKSGHSYTPQETVNYETLVKLTFEQLLDKVYFDGALKTYILAYYQIPKSASKVKAELMRTGKIRPTQKPDCDNIAKIICDALNGLAYRDDSQIVSCEVEKYFADEPRVRVILEAIE